MVLWSWLSSWSSHCCNQQLLAIEGGAFGVFEGVIWKVDLGASWKDFEGSIQGWQDAYLKIDIQMHET